MLQAYSGRKHMKIINHASIVCIFNIENQQVAFLFGQ